MGSQMCLCIETENFRLSRSQGQKITYIRYLFLCEFANSNVAYVANSDKRGSENSKLKVKMLAMSTICFIWEEDL